MVLAVGDIHGCADELRLLLDKLRITPETTLLFIGDYIDRGPKSRQVIEIVLELTERCHVIALKGNHEAMLLEFLDDPRSSKAASYIFNGGSSTLASYSDDRGEIEIPEYHLAFMRRLRVYHETEHNLFVHAGIPNIPIEELDPAEHGREMLWVRDTFLHSEFPWSKIVVHGHTPVPEVTFAANRINIDTGCVFRGSLTALELPRKRILSVPRQRIASRIYLRNRNSRRAAVRFRGAAPVRVQCGAITYLFHTEDYSELGMLMCSADIHLWNALQVDDLISGVIGNDLRTMVSFRGRVVRTTQDDRGICYGVEFLSLRPVD